MYQRCVDARAKVAARAHLAEALGEVHDADAARMVTDRALKAWVRVEFGQERVEANDFGFPAPKKPTMTAEQKALAVERGRATRKARGTMGPRQKVKADFDEHAFSGDLGRFVELAAVA